MRRVAVVLLLALLAAGCIQDLPLTRDADPAEISELVRNRDTVWEVAFSPDGRVFLTERPGRVQVVDADGVLGTDPWARIGEVAEVGESGLMGLALHPAFPETPYVYLSHTYRDDGGQLRNRIVRMTDDGGQGTDYTVILDGIAGANIHDGSRVKFGPEGTLWVTTGDAAEASNAQDRDSLSGKVLRMTPDGGPIADRPYNGSRNARYVWTWGHRNPQGLAFRPSDGQAVVSEHGPENHDEVNVLRRGVNYGWPDARGPQTDGGRYEPAIWSSGSGGTVAPAGAVFVDAPGSPLHEAFVFATLKEAQIHVMQIADDDAGVAAEDVIFDGSWGRLRAATWGPDDALYVSTSNNDGRGHASARDDRVIRIPLGVLEERVDWD